MKHIALISTSYPEGNTGQAAAGSFVEDFAIALSNHIDITVIAPGVSHTVIHRGRLTIQYFVVPRQPLSLLSSANPSHWLAIMRTLTTGQSAVNKVCRDREVDYLFALWALPSGYWAKRASHKYNVPYSVWALGSDIWSLGKIPLIRNVLKKVLLQSQHCFADGYILKQDVERLSKRKCAFLPSSRQLPISGHKKLTTSPPYKLAFLGRWHPNKGIDLLLDSLKLLDEKDWQRIEEIRIFGGGPLEGIVKQNCETLKSTGRPVTIGGYLDKNEAAELLMWTDYALIPSRIESIPVIFSDALQCQCPIVSTPVGDLSRLVQHYRVGTLARDISAQSFSQALSNILCSPPASYAKDINYAARDFSVTHSANEFLSKVM